MKKVTKGAKRRLFCLFIVFLLLVSYMVYNSYNYWDQILENYREKKELTNNYNELIEEQDSLSSDLVKLQDPNYIATYAREKYLYSKDGELILKVVEEKK